MDSTTEQKPKRIYTKRRSPAQELVTEIVSQFPGRSGMEVATQLGRIRGTKLAASYGALNRTAEQGLIHSHPHPSNPLGKTWFPAEQCEDCPPDWACKQDKAAEFHDYVMATHRGDHIPPAIAEANEQYEQEETQRAQAWLDEALERSRQVPVVRTRKQVQR